MNYSKEGISKINDAISAPVTATRDALAEMLQSVRDAASLLKVGKKLAKQKLGY